MKPRPRLQDMPNPVKQRIASRLETYCDKMSLRTACPNYLPVIGNPHFECRGVSLVFRGTGIVEVQLDGDREAHERNYVQKTNGCKVMIKAETEDNWYHPLHGRNPIRDREWFVEGGDFIDLAVMDFKMLVSSNPNFKMERFWLSIIQPSIFPASTFLSKLQSSIGIQLKVKSFQMCYSENQSEVLQILPFLDSESLDNLVLKNIGEDGNLDEVMKLEQWKKVTSLKMSGFVDLPIETWWNFPKTEITLQRVKLEDLKLIFQHFRKLQGFESCVIHTKLNSRMAARALGGETAGFRERFGRQHASFPETKTRIGINVDICDSFIEIGRQEEGGRVIYRRVGGEEEEEEEEQVNRNSESKRILESLKTNFCEAVEKPVLIGMEDGVVMHFEWDDEKKSWRKMKCEKCTQVEEKMGRYGLFEEDYRHFEDDD